MHLRQTRRLGTAVAITAALLLAAACSNNGSSATSSASPAESGSASVQSGGAVSATAQYLSPPTALPVTAPVAKAIPAKAKIVWVASGVPQAVTILKGLNAAAATLGWTVNSLTYDPTNPATITTSIDSAIAEKPAAIVLDSLLTAQFAAKIPKAAAAHIPLIAAAAPDQPQDDVYPVLITKVEEGYEAKILTDQLLADAAKAGNTAHVLQLTVPAFASVLDPEDNGVKAELAAKCPGCTQNLLDISLPDVFNGNYTQQVVSYLQSHPGINYIVSDSGQLGDGLGAALQQAGISDVKDYGFSPSDVQIKGLQNGQAGAWVAQPYQEQGWQIADETARVLAGDPTNLWDGEHLAYVLTAGNAKDVDPNDQEFPAGYQGQFKKLWGK